MHLGISERMHSQKPVENLVSQKQKKNHKVWAEWGKSKQNSLHGCFRPHKKNKVVSRPLPPHFWVPHHVFFFYKNADNALEIELKRSKIEMPLSF